MSASHLPPKPGPPPLHCAKCAEHNERTAERCRRCHARLWVKCRRCSLRSPRTHSRCTGCKGELPTGLLETVKHTVKKLARKVVR
ncbi:MAG: hypothetical protein FD161_1511 [Limisphaerales bacterium]|nr:MAG: hypothetical protein FD161_1511 [Limisphaerales bacterium]KAG0509325.1 MAG: hypothetical protein E1N63_1430 [Limisphaerales bacterium]TXT52070.1 MAG: hypothetical protein FD140_1003 [Limisphaerales bacterium]